MPTVSIITCTYNRAHLIGETIKHVLNQTLADFEYIVVDESSTDNTEEIISHFNDSRIKYYKIPNTKGHLSKLRNFGMQQATGKYFAFVDSDDLWMVDKLEQQIKELDADLSIGFSYTDIQTFNNNGIIQHSIYNKQGNFKGPVFEDFIQNNFVICATTLLFRKDCLEKIGYQDETFLSGDFDFIVALAANFKAFVIYSPLVKVLRHTDNVSDLAHLNRKFSHLKTLDKLKEKKIITTASFNAIRNKVYYAFGMQLLRVNEYKWANRFFLKTIICNPFQIKPWIRLFLTLGKQAFS